MKKDRSYPAAGEGREKFSESLQRKLVSLSIQKVGEQVDFGHIGVAALVIFGAGLVAALVLSCARALL